MNLNPKLIIEKGIITPTENTSIEQVGVDLSLKDTITVRSRGFTNVELAEKFNMQNYFGMLIIRSSFSRQGIFMTSGIFDAGFKGVGGISLYNMSVRDIKILAGTRICQLIVFKADYAKLYNGHYNLNKNINSKLEVYCEEGVCPNEI